MKNKDKIKRKAGVLLVVWLMIAISIGSVLGGTVTNTDVSTTVSDTDMVINYQNATITFLEQFMVNGTTPRWINDSSDDVVTFIRSSNGSYWNFDGTNDEVQVQDALDDGKRTVYLPAGDLYFDADVDIVNNTRIIGEGIGITTIHLRAGATYGFKTTTAGTSYVPFRHNFTISDMTIDAEGTNAYSCIYLSRCHNVKLENLYLNGSSVSNLYLSGNCKRFNIDNIYTTGMIHVSGGYTPAQLISVSKLNDSLINNIFAFGPTDAMAMIDFASCNNCSFNNIYISRCNSSGFKLGGGTHPTQNCNFNNIFISDVVELTNSRGFFTDGIVKDCNFNNINIRNGGSLTLGTSTLHAVERININNVDINNSFTSGKGISILKARDINIDNAIVRRSLNSDLYISTSNNITIINSRFIGGKYINHILNCKDITINTCTVEDNRHASYCLYIENSNDCSISYNRFLNNTGSVTISGCGDSSISNNHIWNCPKDGIALATCENNSVHNNFIRNCRDGIIIKTNSYNNTIQDNMIRNSSDDAIDETSTSNYNYISGNDVRFNTVDGIIEHDGANSVVKDNIGYDYNSLFPYYEQATPPTMNENTTAYWYNTTSLYSYQVFNFYGTQTYLNLSSTTY